MTDYDVSRAYWARQMHASQKDMVREYLSEFVEAHLVPYRRVTLVLAGTRPRRFARRGSSRSSWTHE